MFYFFVEKDEHFDLPDRMFHSIKAAWLSASQQNKDDVRELIPEFFYLPDFLVNYNNFDLGTKQNGIRVHDVLLPPWAKSDSREFIRMHREVGRIYKNTNINVTLYILKITSTGQIYH